MTEQEHEPSDHGTLSEAIQQHLALKRRQGATEDEIAQERDAALGPARRETESKDDQTPPSPEPTPTSDQQPVVEEPEPVEQETQVDESLEFDFVEPPLPAESESQLEPESYAEPSVQLEPEPPRQSETGERGEDLLESTPEFFEGTPEYDRLWFEEKSPRDFDF